MDHKSVQKLYEAALAIEKSFDSSTAASDPFKNLIQNFILLSQSVPTAASIALQMQQTDLQKIGALAKRLNRQKNQGWSHRQFLDLLVPLERYLNKQITDSDLIHDHPDSITTTTNCRSSIILIADHIRSAFNIGAFFRTGDAFAIEKIILTGYSPTAEHPAVAKTALGSQNFVPWQYFETTEQAVHEVKQNGYQVCALETTTNAKNIYHFQIPEKLALIVGNERFGIGPSLLKSVDHIIEIPMLGQKNSLNVATSFALVAFEWQRHWRH